MPGGASRKSPQKPQWKFIIGGVVILCATIYLIFTATRSSAQYFYTISELLARRDELIGQDLRVSGAVIGDSIQYDTDSHVLTFTIAEVPASNAEIEAQGGLAAVLLAAVNDPTRPRLQIVSHEAPSDLLQGEAQVILTGTLGEDGVFNAERILLKCPSRYEYALPTQAGE